MKKSVILITITIVLCLIFILFMARNRVKENVDKENNLLPKSTKERNLKYSIEENNDSVEGRSYTIYDEEGNIIEDSVDETMLKIYEDNGF